MVRNQRQRSAYVVNTVCAQYEIGDVVCPPDLVKNVFTTDTVDSIDHSPFSSSSFHGTAISIMQHPSSEDDSSPLSAPLFDAEAD